MTGGGANDSLNLECAVTANPIFSPSSICKPTLPLNIASSNTAIADTGASGIYLTHKAPCANINPTALQVVVGTAGGPPHCFSASCDVNLPIPVTKEHLMPNFRCNLMVIVPLCDHSCRVLFGKTYVNFFSQTAPSYYVAGVNPMETSCEVSPSNLKIVQRFHHNGDRSQPHSIYMTCQVW